MKTRALETFDVAGHSVVIMHRESEGSFPNPVVPPMVHWSMRVGAVGDGGAEYAESVEYGPHVRRNPNCGYCAARIPMTLEEAAARMKKSATQTILLLQYQGEIA